MQPFSPNMSCTIATRIRHRIYAYLAQLDWRNDMVFDMWIVSTHETCHECSPLYGQHMVVQTPCFEINTVEMYAKLWN